MASKFWGPIKRLFLKKLGAFIKILVTLCLNVRAFSIKIYIFFFLFKMPFLRLNLRQLTKDRKIKVFARKSLFLPAYVYKYYISLIVLKMSFFQRKLHFTTRKNSATHTALPYRKKVKTLFLSDIKKTCAAVHVAAI